MTFKIKLVKELEQNKGASNVDMGCFIHPYREYMVEYLKGENYKLIIDDKLVGNRGGSYKIKLILLRRDEGSQYIVMYIMLKDGYQKFLNIRIQNMMLL